MPMELFLVEPRSTEGLKFSWPCECLKLQNLGYIKLEFQTLKRPAKRPYNQQA